MSWHRNFPQERFCELIASGKTEYQALDVVNDELPSNKKKFNEAIIVLLQVRIPEFKDKVEEAKRLRADYWFSGIAESAQKVIDKDEVAGEKLKFEQRKYLAAMDNPEKYSEKMRHQVDVQHNIFAEMKNLPAKEVSKLLKSADPFAIEAEYDVVEESESAEAVGDEEDINIFE